MMLKNKTEQVSEFLLAKIHDGILHPGDRIPSERELTEQLAVSRVIVRRALTILEENKTLTRTESGSRIVAAAPLSEGNLPEIGFALHSRWIRDTYYLDIIRGLEEKAGSEFKIKIFFHNMVRQNIYIKENIKILFLDHVYSENEVRMLQENGIFAISLMRESQENNYVSFDAFDAGYKLGKFLYEQGHRDIVHFVHAPAIQPMEGFYRRQGLLKAEAEFGFKLIPVDIFLAEQSGIFNIHSAIDYLLTTGIRFSAIIAPDEKGAVEVNEILESNGFSVPEDVSIATFGSNFAVPHLSFPLTAATFPPSLVAERLLSVVHTWLKSRKPFPCRETIPSSIISKACPD